METDEQRVWNGGPRDQTDDLHLAKLPATSILNCGNLTITNYLITIVICTLGKSSNRPLGNFNILGQINNIQKIPLFQRKVFHIKGD